MNNLGTLLLSLTRGAVEKPVGVFKDWALNEINTLIPMDSCVWGTGTWVDGLPRVHSVHLHNLDSDFVSNWMRYQHQDTLARATQANLDKVLNIDVDAEFAGTDIYEHHCLRYSMRHILAIATIDPDTLLLNTASFYRANPNSPFSEHERSLMEIVFQHLVETTRINWLTNLPNLAIGRQQNSFAALASCDRMGYLQVAVPTFVAECRREWPDWHGPTLPPPIVDIINTGELKYVGRNICVNLLQLDEVFLVRARPKLAADSLSPREIEVAQLFASGLDYKSVALSLEISPSTARAHLSKIYTKLGISGKVGLHTELQRLAA